jgi:hypothetical protein
MKRLGLILMVMMLAIGFGCSDAQAKKNRNAKFTDLPTLSQEFILKYFPQLTIDAISIDGDREADVRFADGTELEFGRDGYFKEIDNERGLSTAQLQMLPGQMLTSLTKDFAGYRIESVEHGDLFYKVDLEGTNGKDIEIHYDLNGQYLY